MADSLTGARLACLFLCLALLASCSSEQPAAKATADKGAQATPAPISEEDIRIGRDLMSLTDVIAALRSGMPREKVLEEVRRRKLATPMVEAHDLEFAANGAGRELIAACKDPKNLATAPQEAVYMQLVMERQRSATKVTAK